jgi:hypothetical protein
MEYRRAQSMQIRRISNHNCTEYSIDPPDKLSASSMACAVFCPGLKIPGVEGSIPPLATFKPATRDDSDSCPERGDVSHASPRNLYHHFDLGDSLRRGSL